MKRPDALPLLFPLALILLTLPGCAGPEERSSRSIEEIHHAEGVPVITRPVETTPFRTYVSYTGRLSGITESTATALVSDRVEEIRLRVGDRVRRDTPVVIFPRDNPSVGFEQARVNLENARQAYERTRRLHLEEGVSRQAYDNARTQFEVAQANWQTARKMVEVQSPLTGYITRMAVSESDNVQPGDPLFTVSVFDRLKTTVWTSDHHAEMIAPGLPARAIWRDREIRGVVQEIDMAMDKTTRAFSTKLQFDNPDLAVRSGVTATIHIETYRQDEAILLLQQDLRSDAEGFYVYVAEEGRAARRPVLLGRHQGVYREVLSGLVPGDHLVSQGIDQLREGRTLRVMGQESPLMQP
ncbi:hypothetical protein AU468_10090 [Alkalispirochaeta sphaeroplastigenens]|uniref:Multidrug resistance protein MdtA-like alpha-helical hairpin domain-containing protein n=1 Tax=Alkalispirochaeta sphaeroplastigenens TaxID=1187066 RepID=A0A2S4JJI4_9SPIO|nr:efflux RND transporter periplasmic adaptor subunit [Alkalispirochaeta sphaeroplastigenens]POQ99651.1 hypothetical protein AU468_10090 [Alkalispirochaeta sphaeroplastigenens]